MDWCYLERVRVLPDGCQSGHGDNDCVTTCVIALHRRLDSEECV